jgi:drug/metabolite transporter (DMT)-like permease
MRFVRHCLRLINSSCDAEYQCYARTVREFTNSKYLGIALSIITALSFASLSIVGKLAQTLHMPSSSLLFWRFLIAGLILMTLTWRTSISGKTRSVLLAFGMVYFVQTAMYFAALERISAGTASLLLYLAPAFVVLYQRGLFGKHPKLEQLLAIGLSLIGLVVILGLPSERDRNLFGLFIAVATGACYGAYLTASERLLSGVPAFAVTAHTSLASALGFALYASSRNELRLPNSNLEWALVAGIVAVPTLIAIPAMFASIGKIGASRASILFTLEPAFVVLLAALLLGEPLGFSQLLGGALILASAILAQLPGKTSSV